MEYEHDDLQYQFAEPDETYAYGPRSVRKLYDKNHTDTKKLWGTFGDWYVATKMPVTAR